MRKILTGTQPWMWRSHSRGMVAHEAIGGDHGRLEIYCDCTA
jgi:hypothetical protein